MLSPATATPEPEPQSIEVLIGTVVAAAAIALLRALYEWENGLTPAARTAGGDLVAQLWELRQSTLGEIDFEQVARIYGTQALKKRCNGDYSATAGNILINNVLEILDKVVRTQLN
jgi:hypothetical protein